MKKLSLIMFTLLPGIMQCASSSDEEQAAIMEQQRALLRVMDLARPDMRSVPEIHELVLEYAHLPGGRLAITSSNIAIATLLVSPPGEKGYALAQWKTITGKPGALALCAQSGRNTGLPMLMPMLDYICKGFVNLCAGKLETSSDTEALEELQKKIGEAAEEIKTIPLGQSLFVSGILVQNDMFYSLMGNDSFSAIKIGSGRNVREQKTNYTIGCGPFSSSWDPR